MLSSFYISSQRWARACRIRECQFLPSKPSLLIPSAHSLWPTSHALHRLECARWTRWNSSELEGEAGPDEPVILQCLPHHNQSDFFSVFLVQDLYCIDAHMTSKSGWFKVWTQNPKKCQCLCLQIAFPSMLVIRHSRWYFFHIFSTSSNKLDEIQFSPSRYGLPVLICCDTSASGDPHCISGKRGPLRFYGFTVTRMSNFKSFDLFLYKKGIFAEVSGQSQTFNGNPH